MREAPFSKGVLSIITIGLLYYYHSLPQPLVLSVTLGKKVIDKVDQLLIEAVVKLLVH